jgi:iron complex transport system substrate-binding protein
MNLDDVTGIVIDSALAVHRGLAPGLLESVYATVLAGQLIRRGLRAEREVPIPIYFDDMRFEVGFRADVLVEERILVELKSVERLARCTGSSCSPTFASPTCRWGS